MDNSLLSRDCLTNPRSAVYDAPNRLGAGAEALQKGAGDAFSGRAGGAAGVHGGAQTQTCRCTRRVRCSSERAERVRRLAYYTWTRAHGGLSAQIWEIGAGQRGLMVGRNE